MNKAITVILVMLIMMNIANAQIAINSFNAVPSVISPGKQVQVTLDIENVGSEDIEDIVVKLDLTNVPFAPYNSASEKVIDELNEDDNIQVVFDLIVLPDASSEIYKIPVEINHGTIKQSSLVSLSVAGDARLDVVLENSEVVKIGDRGNVIVKFINNGLTDIKFLTVKLNSNSNYELLTPDTVYIGQVDVDDFETAEFEILAKNKNPEMLFTVSYKDANNREFSQSKLVRLNVYDMETAKQLGLIQSSILGYIAVPIVILLIGWFWYRRRKKRKLNI